jgi:hypothetical protein
MDAIVTIQILDGKKQVGTIEKAVEIHPTIANEIKETPGLAGAWILSQAKEKINAEGAEFIKTSKNQSSKAD